MSLSKLELSFWKKNSYLKLKDFFSLEEKKNLLKWSSEIENWEETPGKWMKYFESTNKSPRQLCRIENFLQYHDGFNELARGEKTLELLSSLMKEKAVLFKEKINFKLPGVGGFTPHQDYPAFLSFGQHYHITMMIALDYATLQNGCLQVATNDSYQKKVLPQENDKTISRELCKEISWTPIECQKGDVLFFDSFLPHYSETNQSSKARRAISPTYNRMSDSGSKREEYFKDKRLKFPPECERIPGKDYSSDEKIYNVANPIHAQKARS